MSADAVARIGLGRKFPAAYKDRPLGGTAMFAHLDRDAIPYEQTLSGQMAQARLVSNSGATALKPGQRVKYTAPGTKVEGAVAADQAAGYVDPWLNADVAQDEVFWIIEAGPTKVLSGAAFSANAALNGDANGKSVTGAVDLTTSGRAIAAATAADQLVWARVNCLRCV